ncbi:hypothetical protein FA13DRAFT_1035805 [Coprinellus micaceus]|uniref:Uncharacterized protein n=1 Tax=Coprinellus micaceus TaxID=71717 RepID=A0A4Y7RN35_COPMI|nr:hypothetical protein FA13DRAFT_1035805 [Coprinellus micaceus]
MSLRVGWNLGSTAEDECQEVVMQDPPCWTATSAVLKAGRGLSSWLFNNLSPPSSPLVSSFFCKDAFTPRQISNPSYLPQPAASHTSYPPPTPSFIGILPQELLEEIFCEYLHGATTSSPSPGNVLRGSLRRIVTCVGAKTTPFTLGHVCSRWRAITTSCPPLWSKLCAFGAEPSDIPLFERWLSMSLHCPLDLTIAQRRGPDTGTVDTTTYQLLCIALQNSDRWQSVSLRLDQDLEPLFTTLVPLSRLRRFRLDLDNWTPEGYHAISQILLSSPNIEAAAWGNACWIPRFGSCTMGTTLRSIKLGQVNTQDLCALLALTPLLQSLVCDFVEVPYPNPPLSSPPSGPIDLLHLSSISLVHYDDPSPLFNSLHLPALSSLALGAGLGSAAAGGAGWASLNALVQRSDCCISSLSWSHDRLAEDALVHSFTQASTTVFLYLRHLNIGSPVSRKFIEALNTPIETNPPIFPDLQSLELRDCNVDYDILRVMLISRLSLQKVDIKIRDDNGAVEWVSLGRSQGRSEIGPLRR